MLKNTIFGRKRGNPEGEAVQRQAQKDSQLEECRSSRKPRSDKIIRKDIKARLSSKEVELLAEQALKNGLSLTAFASKIVKDKLAKIEKDELAITRPYKDYFYDDNGEFVHVLLEEEFYPMLFKCKVKWRLPFRKIAHRIIKEYISDHFNTYQDKEKEEREDQENDFGFKIYSYNQR